MDRDRNHVISAGYIRNWTVDDVVECELVDGGQRLKLPPSQVGVRKKFYAASPSPDGSRPAAVAETERGAIETRALPLIRQLGQRWPLTDAGERAWVALWIAMILCASPRQRGEIPGMVGRFLDEMEREAPLLAWLTRAGRQELREADFELDSMFDAVSTVASIIGQMHWALLRFSRPELVSSDHPITQAAWSRTDAGGHVDVSLLGSLEVRVPLDPRDALLLTWADADDRVPGHDAPRHQLAAFNHGAWAQAETHRFWRPGTTPRGIDARPVAVSAASFPAYDIRNSARLDATTAWLQTRTLDRARGVEDRAVVTAWMTQTTEGLKHSFVRHEGEHAQVLSSYSL
ncbi:DUF4238 domain-containing protein [Capillimicrobium parvum]|uniref:DUF4238 domain-containing protein n=1 Tax=Capillimicrobium parvum TaxID=2884022 RepID=A0A9E6XXA3_9ACTN|nr:DUF4238 domain-containing protein [Capillimicrobium parvum]UGS36109.1 hypothetical protein DSM104329_02509 [Capillimicrobium parvum]